MKDKVYLDAEQQGYLHSYLHKGKHPARAIRRARMLLLLHQGKTYKQVAQIAGCALNSVTNLVIRYREVKGNVIEALSERPRPGQPPLITPEVEAHITALACSKTPDGRKEWTLQMIAHRIVEMKLVPHLSDEAVRGVLKKKQAKTVAKTPVVHF